MASARRTCSSPGGLAMADDDDLGLLGIDTFEAFQGLDFEEDEHSSQSSVLRASSTRLPRCAVLNFQRVGDCVSMRPRAFTDTAGIAARIRHSDCSSFMLEEHSSRALNFKPSQVSETTPISFRSDAITGHWTNQPVKRSYLDDEKYGSFASLFISESDATAVSGDSSISSDEIMSRRERGSASVGTGKKQAPSPSLKTSDVSSASKSPGTRSYRSSSRNKSKARKKRLSREKSAMSRFLAFMTRKSSSKKVTPVSSVSSMDSQPEAFGKWSKAVKNTMSKAQPSKNGNTSCFPYSMRDDRECSGESTEFDGPGDAYDSFTGSRKKSQWKVGRPTSLSPHS